VAALLVADHHHLAPVEARHAADDRLVVGEGAVAGELDELVEEELDVVERERSRRMAAELHLLPRRELGEDLFLELASLLLQALDLLAKIDAAARELAQLVDLLLELDDRPLELEDLPIGARARDRSGAGAAGGLRGLVGHDGGVIARLSTTGRRSRAAPPRAEPVGERVNVDRVGALVPGHLGLGAEPAPLPARVAAGRRPRPPR